LAQPVTVHRARRGLVTAGAVTFGVTYGFAATISFLLIGSTSNNKDYMWIPIAGPAILAMGSSGSDDAGFFFLWSAAEAAGVAMFIVGLMGHDVIEYRLAERGPTLRLTPLLARETGGLALTARW